jgi:hypothetical protein
LWELSLDESGIPTQLHRSWANQEDALTFHWSKRPPKPWLLNEETKALRLGSFAAENNSAKFERLAVAASGLDSVTRIAEAKALLVQQSLARQGVSIEKGNGANQDSPAIDPFRFRSRWIIIGGGVIACAGFVGWFVRRAQQARGRIEGG